VVAADRELDNIRDLAARVATRHSLPDFLAEKLVTELDEPEALAEALNRRAPMSIRGNTLKTSRAELLAELRAQGLEAREGQLAPNCVNLETRTNLFALDAFQRGHFEAQDEGSQLLVELLRVPPRAMVVDFCAGAGGKTLAVAAALENRGRVLASDVDQRKLQELRRRVRRAGATNVQTVVLDNEPGSALPKPYQSRLGQADRVLVDAPCSGFGALRRNPESRYRLQPADFERLPALQKRILASAYELLKVGGELVYATCTLFPAENQEVVADFLARHRGAELVPAAEVLGRPELCDPTGSYLLLRPDRHGCDGFFAAVIRRLS
jgi:16S rRNA (cytosine967-C5)-methyltransferase